MLWQKFYHITDWISYDRFINFDFLEVAIGQHLYPSSHTWLIVTLFYLCNNIASSCIKIIWSDIFPVGQPFFFVTNKRSKVIEIILPRLMICYSVVSYFKFYIFFEFVRNLCNFHFQYCLYIVKQLSFCNFLVCGYLIYKYMFDREMLFDTFYFDIILRFRIDFCSLSCSIIQLSLIYIKASVRSSFLTNKKSLGFIWRRCWIIC